MWDGGVKRTLEDLMEGGKGSKATRIRVMGRQCSFQVWLCSVSE